MGQKNKKVYVVAILFSLFTGLSFLFVKIALQSSDPFDFLAYRFAVAFISVLIMYAFKMIRFEHSFKQILKIVPISLIYPLAYFAFQTFGLQYITSAEGSIIMASTPILTLLMASIFLKEKTTLFQKVSIFISAIGVIYITLSAFPGMTFSNIKGLILVFLSALSFTGYNVMARKLTQEFSNTEIISVMILISFLGYNTASISKHLLKGTLRDFFMPLSDPSFIIAVLYLGVICVLITSLMSNYILSKIEASKMSVFTNLRTFIAIVVGAIFLKENVYYYHIIGSILIVGGVFGANYTKK
jgi:drug/metabolite transporter (DMT)-like permease